MIGQAELMFFFPPRLVGSVCIEYLVRLQRTDVLFRDVWQMFKERQHGEIFLRLLEPGILTDKLTYVVPEIMQAFVAHYAHNRMLHRIEQCILHMDIASMDFHQVRDKYTLLAHKILTHTHQVVTLCREHSLSLGLLYVYNKGLDDYITPLDHLMTLLANEPEEDSVYRRNLGYKVILIDRIHCC